MMQSGGRYDIGRNQMVSVFPGGGTSALLASSEDNVMEQGKDAKFIRLVPVGIAEFVEVTEQCHTLQPVSDGTTGEHVDTTITGVNDYKGNNAIRAYNFIIEDQSDQMRLVHNVENEGEKEKVAISMATLRAVKDELEDEIATVAGHGDAYLTKADAEITYETISAHNTDKSALESSISAKANAADVYTKSQVDSSLSAKANAADVYTKAETDSAIASGVSGKANATDVYTKAETDTLLSAKVDTTTLTTNYYTKPETYTKVETNDEITKITYINNIGSEIIDWYDWDEHTGQIDPETGEEIIIHHHDPIYDSDTKCEESWQDDGSKVLKLSWKAGSSMVKTLVKRLFLEPKISRIKSACLAATGALVGTKIVGNVIAFGTTAAVNISEIGGDDDPGEIEFDDDYHGDRIINNVVRDSEYTDMEYTEGSETHTLAPDTTVPTVQAVKSHHYTKGEVDTLISQIPGPDLSNYYNKAESDARFINVDEPVELLARKFNVTLTNINDIIATSSRAIWKFHTFTAESTSIQFEFRNIAAWTHSTRYPSSMDNVVMQLIFKISGKADQEFTCTFSDYYTGILDDAHYHNVECDKFFDVFCSGTIDCDDGDVIDVYLGYKDTNPPSGGDVGSFEPAQDGHTKYFRGISTTTIADYYNKAESDDRYYTKTDADARFAQIAPSSTSMAITSDTYSDAAYAKNSTSYAKIPLSVLTPADSGSLAIDFNIKVAISDTKDDGTYTSEYNDYTYGIYLKRYYSVSAYNEYYYKDVLKPTYNSTTNILTLTGRFNCDVINACNAAPCIAITNKDPSTGSSDTRWFTVTSGTITANLLPTTSLSHHSIARYNIADSTWTPTFNGATGFIYEINLDADSTYMFDFNFRKIMIQQIDGVDYDGTDDTQYGHRDIANDLRWRMCFSINNVWVYDTAACYVTRLNAGEVSMSGHFMYHSESACKAGFKIAMKYDGLYTGADKTIEFSIAGTCSQPNFVQITKL